MSNRSIVEASAEIKKGNDRRAVCILCSNEKPMALSKNVSMLGITGIEILY